MTDSIPAAHPAFTRTITTDVDNKCAPDAHTWEITTDRPGTQEFRCTTCNVEIQDRST